MKNHYIFHTHHITPDAISWQSLSGETVQCDKDFWQRDKSLVFEKLFGVLMKRYQ